LRGLDRIKGLVLEKARLRRSIVSCQRRNAIYPHTLLTGIGGTGKTYLAIAIAEELGYYIFVVEGAAIKTRDILISILQNAQREARSNDQVLLFFIDEIHRLSSVLQEALYYPLVENYITTATGDIHFDPFTMIGATTQPQALDKGSFITRCRRIDIGRYAEMDIGNILRETFDEMGIEHKYNPELIRLIAQRSLGLPRRCRELAAIIRDQIYYRGGDIKLTKTDLNEVFRLEKLDSIGLDEKHQLYLMALLKANDPMGIKSLSGRLGLSESEVEEMIEPILLSLGFVVNRPRGRILTSAGYQHLAEEGKV